MTISTRAVLKWPYGRQLQLSLFKIQELVYRWVEDASGKPYNGIDFLDITSAVKHLRVEIESGIEFVGVDLTIIPVAAPPEERAAVGCARYFLRSDDPEAVSKLTAIIREECAIDRLLEHVNLLIVYRLRGMRMPKPPGLDMAEGGLLLQVIEDIEIAQQVDLSNLKKSLTADVSAIKVYSALPPTG